MRVKHGSSRFWSSGTDPLAVKIFSCAPDDVEVYLGTKRETEVGSGETRPMPRSDHTLPKAGHLLSDSPVRILTQKV